MKRVDISDPDLNAMHLLTSAAPGLSMLSSPEPALGYVIVTVLVEHESSVTTIKPLGSVVTFASVAFLGAGERVGILHKHQRCKKILTVALQSNKVKTAIGPAVDRRTNSYA